MDQTELFRAYVDALERDRPDLKGVPLSQVPELATFRYRFRRSFYRWADVNFALAIFNAVLALSPLNSVAPVNAIMAGAAAVTMVVSEQRARAMSRQLNRPAIEQIARDLVGWRG